MEKKLVDVAADVGLDLGPTTSAIFADFDNDGDQDAVVGCFFQSCKLMFNEDGKYVDRTSQYVSVDLPKLTTSISAALITTMTACWIYTFRPTAFQPVVNRVAVVTGPLTC